MRPTPTRKSNSVRHNDALIVCAIFSSIALVAALAAAEPAPEPSVAQQSDTQIQSPNAGPHPSSTPSPTSDSKSDTGSTDTTPDVIYATGDSIEIAHPYEPKALGIVPQGWTPKPIPDYTVRNPNVHLKDGTAVSIDCPIHQLVPDTAAGYHALREPGFDPQKGTNQTNTLGAILLRSIAAQTALSQQTNEVLAQLEMTVNKELYNTDTTQAQKNLMIDKPAAPSQNASPSASPSPNPKDPADKDKHSQSKSKEKEKPSAHPYLRSKPKPKPSPTPTPTHRGLFW